MSEVRLYIEGARRAGLESRLRRGFSEFFSKGTASKRRPRIIMGGGREQTIADFVRALASHPGSVSLLLVDSEGPVAPSGDLDEAARNHLAGRLPADVDGAGIHLMVQLMEAWFAADPSALARHFGQGFVSRHLQNLQDVEAIAKADLIKRLEQATRASQKGGYDKSRDSGALLEQVQPSSVRLRSKYCARFLERLRELLD